MNNVELSNSHIRSTRNLSLNSVILENTIREYPYTGEKRIKDDIAENTKFPPIVAIFYSFVFDYDNVPSPEELIDLYLSQDFFSDAGPDSITVNYQSKIVTVNKEGLTTRILRTYPSLMRDLHFYFLCVESQKFEYVYYSVKDDFEYGVDVRVNYNGILYEVALLQNTSRAKQFREKKKQRHNGKNADAIYIELDPDESKRCGDYNLYTEKHVEYLIDEIKKKQEKQINK